MSKTRIISAVLFCLLSNAVHAETIDSHVVVAPNCLLKNLKPSYQTLSANTEFALILANDQVIEQLNAVKHQQKSCGSYIDATQDWYDFKTKSPAADAKVFLKNFITMPSLSYVHSNPQYKIQYEKQVQQILAQTNPQNMWTHLTTLTSFKDRYANSSNGIDAANWLKTQVESLAKQTGHAADMTIYFINTRGYKQPSLVAKFGKSSGPGIVVGAHMDTLSSTFSKKPGADDDGTGSVTVLETARTLLASGMHFKKPIYFIWYAAEEEGLVGSANVVAEFKNKNIPIDAVLHFDMTGYTYQNDPSMWLITDYVNKDLTGYLETLIKTYVKQTVNYTQCGYGCSDHASWSKKGFPASIAAETKFENTNPSMHTANDTMDKLSLTHMTDYLKLALAFSVELAEPMDV